MQAAHTSARTEKANASHASERKCLVTGEVRAKGDLIRFVAGPDNSVIPDLAQNLPGRGLWVTADREAIAAAARKNLFSKAAKNSVKADPDLADDVAKLLRKRCLQFLGMAKGSGIAVLGETQVESALRARKLALLFLASDASHPADNRYSVPENRSFNRHELGAALGYEQIVYAGLMPHGITEKLTAELARLEKIAPQPISSLNNGTQ